MNEITPSNVSQPPVFHCETEVIHAAIRTINSQLTLRTCSERPLRASMESAYRALLDRQYRRLEDRTAPPTEDH